MKNETLTIIIPVYNEEASIEKVVNDWFCTLENLNIDFKICLYNDGSKDNSFEVLNKLALNNNRIIVKTHPNIGHGPTILKGYLENLNSDYIFQVDSDDEISAEKFHDFWNQKQDFDAVFARRIYNRKPLSRSIISFIAFLIIRMFYGKGIYDVNVPFRLMKTKAVKNIIEKIPPNTFAPNIIISGMICFNKLKIKTISVQHQHRKAGQVSIKKWKLFKASFLSFKQIIAFCWNSI
jgi:glycosyltransferase involved in cell wall biosynthesis